MVIKDIRLYRSQIENVNGNSLPQQFNHRLIIPNLTRLVMKLREFSFSLGDFDHLYINFTTCIKNGEIVKAKRSIDRYNPWYRYYDVGVDYETYCKLDVLQDIDWVFNIIKELLLNHFQYDECLNEKVLYAIEEVREKKEKVVGLYKEKKSSKNIAQLYLKVLDNGYFLPSILVTDDKKNELLKVELPKVIVLKSIGTIQLSNSKVTIKPRKRPYDKEYLEPMQFTFKSK